MEGNSDNSHIMSRELAAYKQYSEDLRRVIIDNIELKMGSMEKCIRTLESTQQKFIETANHKMEEYDRKLAVLEGKDANSQIKEQRSFDLKKLTLNALLVAGGSAATLVISHFIGGR